MGGPYGITFLAWLLLSPISIFLTIEVVPEGRNEDYSLLVGYLIGLLGHIVTGLMLLLGRQTILRNVDVKPRPITMLTWFAVSGIVRGASVAWMFENWGITESANYFERMRSGAVLVLVWFAVSAVMVDGWNRYKSVYSELSETLDAQKQLRDAGASTLQAQLQELLVQIRKTLSDALRAGSSTGDLHKAVDEMVRPLAHNLAQRNVELTTKPAKVRRRIRMAPVLRTASYDTPYNPGWTSLMAVFGTLSSRIWQSGWVAVADSILMATFIWATFRVYRKLKLFGWWVPALWFVTGLLASIGSAIITNGQLVLNSALLFMAINVVVPAAIVAFIGAFDRNALLNLNRLREVIEQLKWETATLEQRSWVEQKRLARFVHSDLQARIRAFALRMDLAARMPSDQEILELRSECENALSLGGKQQEFETFVRDVSDLWSGVMSIDSRFDADALDALRYDPYASVVAIEVVREGLSNAAKHGLAKNATVELHLAGNLTAAELEILVSHVGMKPETPTLGFGLKTIAELSLRWSLVPTSFGGTLQAAIPIHFLRKQGETSDEAISKSA